MISHKQIDKSTTHGHVLFLYNSEKERFLLLSDYFAQGLDKNELCIFVTSDPLEDAIQNFEAIGFNAGKYFSEGNLKIFEMIPTYLPNGQFISDYMLGNVLNFINDAKNLGFNGIRTAGEMSWLNDHHDSIQETKSYEQDVNGLANPEDNFVGLCMYPIHSTSDNVVQDAMRTHPSMIYDGQVQSNPLYALK